MTMPPIMSRFFLRCCGVHGLDLNFEALLNHAPADLLRRRYLVALLRELPLEKRERFHRFISGKFIGLAGYAIPAFWLGLVGLVVFYGQLGWVGGPGRIDFFLDGMVPVTTGLLLVDSALDGNWEAFQSAFSHIILPAMILGFFALAYIARMTRSFMLEQLSQEFITTARVKGVPERVILWRHAFRPIRVQLITVIGLSYAGLLEGSVMIEIVFSWPGIGSYLTTALLNADMNAVLGATLVIGAVFVGINKGSDALYRIIDPRARA